MGTEQKVAVITGASQGIGAALVNAYLDRNYRVVATARSVKAASDADILVVPGDIADRKTTDCFISAMKLVAGKLKVTVPPDLAIDAEVDLGPTDGAYGLAARLNVSLPGIAREVAQALVDEAHQVCPYSRATRGNIDVAINLV
jgi:NAD(P)-dependent dehydrogenase (short-subunit alcohol dehydrogenase family)